MLVPLAVAEESAVVQTLSAEVEEVQRVEGYFRFAVVVVAAAVQHYC